MIMRAIMQESARLMASGDYDAALPVAYEALALGERIFKPAPALQLFPLYLLVAQAGLSTTCSVIICLSSCHQTVACLACAT